MVERKKIAQQDVFNEKSLSSNAPGYQKSSNLKSTATTNVKQFNEPSRVSNISEQENILLKKKPKIEEIHEKPVVEIHEKPIIKNVKEPQQTKYVKDQTIREEYGNKVSGQKLVNEQLASAPKTKKIYKEAKISQKSEQPVVHRQDQLQKEVHVQPVVHEFHEKPVEEIHEQNVVRVVHEKPSITRVKDAPVYVSEDKSLKNMGLNQGNQYQAGANQQGSGKLSGNSGWNKAGGEKFQSGKNQQGNQYPNQL